MPNCDLVKTGSAELADWKMRYLQQVAAPLDGMWQTFVAMADHYSLSGGSQVAGYCVVNSEQQLLQFFVADRELAAGLFAQVLRELNVQGAVVATCEPQYLNLCTAHKASPPTEFSLMYHLDLDRAVAPPAFPDGTELRPVSADQLETAVEFGVAAIGADAAWLAGYYAERIDGAELFGLWQAGELIATGESRPSQIQPPVADVGMIVGPEHRGRGIATNILQWLIHDCRQRSLQPICSTETGNVAAQRAIERAGFTSYQRILQFCFGQESTGGRASVR